MIKELIALLQDANVPAAIRIKNVYVRLLKTSVDVASNKTLAETLPANISADDLRDFLEAFQAAVAENDRFGRASAINHLTGARNQIPQGLSTAKWNRYLFDLCLRVREPKLINQCQTDTCGYASCLVSWARVSPLAYVTYAIDLVRTGKGKLGPKVFEVTATNKDNPAPGKMSDADWITIMSAVDTLAKPVESAFSSWQKMLKTQPVGGLYSGELTNLLTNLGYASIEDCTASYLYNSDDKKRTLLNKAQLLCASHEKREKSVVIMSTWMKYWTFIGNAARLDKTDFGNKDWTPLKPDVELSDDAFKAADKQAREGFTSKLKAFYADNGDHWVVLRSVNIAGDTVTAKVVTWGLSFKVKMSLKSFLTLFGGYVCAQAPN